MRTLLQTATIAAMLTLAACSGDDDDGGDQSAAQIGSLSENATYAYIDDGGAGLYDYLATSVTDQCSKDQVNDTFQDGPNVTGWRQIKDIELTGNDATATVIVIVDGEDENQPWTFAREGDSWRISSLPGLEACTE
jgi:hypothetical protein